MRTIGNNHGKHRKVLTLAIIAIVVLSAGAFILFRSSPDSDYISELSSSQSSATQETRDSPGKNGEEHLYNNLLAGRAAPPRPKTGLPLQPAEEKLNSVLFHNESSEGGREINSTEDSVDMLPGINEDAEADDDIPPFSISGHVLDQRGEPVYGIEVISFAKRLFQSSEDTWVSGETRSTMSDRDGFFTFQNLTEGEYEVSTKATERYSSAKAFLRSGVSSAVLIVEDNFDEIYVYGYVTTAFGTPLPEVRVVPVGLETDDIYTDNTGYYDVPIPLSILRKTYTFRFIREGYREVLLSLRDTDIYGVDDVQLNAELEPINPLASVTGTITDRSKVPIEGARIYLYSTSLRRSFLTISDQNGYFFFQDVEVGTGYTLWIRQVDGYKDYIENGLEVLSSGVNLAVILDPLDFASLTGQMIDISGNPVPWFSLWLRSSSIQQDILVTGDQAGYFFIKEVPEGRLHFLTRSFPYLNVSGIQISPGTNTNTLLVLDVGDNEIFGHVVDVTGNPVPGSEVRLTWSYQEDGITTWSNRRTFTDGNGYFLFSQLGPGQHNLNVTAPGYQRAQQKAEVNSGEILIQLQDDLSNSGSLLND